MTKRKSIEYVREIVESKGGKLLSTEYINNKTPITIQLSDGEIEDRTLNNILKQNPLISKKEKNKNTSKRQRRNIDEIKSIIESRGGKLLSTRYNNKKTPLLIKTSDGIIETRKIDSITLTKTLVSKSKRYDEHKIKSKLSMGEIKSLIESRKGKLIDYNQYVNNRTYIDIECSCGRITSNCIFNIKQNYNIITCKECRPKSQFEDEILKYLKSIYRGDILENNRNIISPQELDFIIPEKKIAIECNGIFWHSDTIKEDKYYHIKKLKAAKSVGYDLIHITDSEWNLKNNIVKDLLSKRLGIVNQKIPANKCKVINLSVNDTKNFLDENHLQGNVNAKYRYGLMFDKNLVSVMLFSKPRFSSVAEFELYRFANKLGTIVMGGFSKLLTHFLREKNPISIISYCDISHFNGSVYDTNNFKLIGESPPNYKYFTKRNYILYSRTMFQKHKLPKLLDNFNPNLTEYENMKNNGYHRIWDCGNFIYIYEKN